VAFSFRDVRHEVFHLKGEAYKNFQKYLKKITFKSPSDLFAFKHPLVSGSGNKKEKKPDDFWNLFSISTEFARLGVGKEWVLKSVNDTYDLCRVYPRQFYCPVNIKVEKSGEGGKWKGREGGIKEGFL
jgi:hypothetical protein